VGPRTGLDDVENRKFLFLPGLEPRTPSVVQPVASRYIDSCTTVVQEVNTGLFVTTV
jgi:hypothetical protein